MNSQFKILSYTFYIYLVFINQICFGQIELQPPSIHCIDNLGNKSDTFLYHKNKFILNDIEFNLIKNNTYDYNLLIKDSLITDNFYGDIIQWNNVVIILDVNNIYIVNSQKDIKKHTFQPGIKIVGSVNQGVWFSCSSSMTNDSLHKEKVYPNNLLFYDGKDLKIKENKNQGKLISKKDLKTKVYPYQALYISNEFEIYRKSTYDKNYNDSTIKVIDKNNENEFCLKLNYIPEVGDFHSYQGVLYCFNQDKKQIDFLCDNSFKLLASFTLVENEIYSYKFLNNNLFFLVNSRQLNEKERFSKGDLSLYNLSNRFLKSLQLKQLD